MAFWDMNGVSASNSRAASITRVTRVADPFTPSNLTMTEIVASTSEDWAGFYVNIYDSGVSGVINVCTGAAASEVSIAILPMHTSGYKIYWFSFYVPIPIPAGTRLSIGASASSGGVTDAQIAGIPSSNFTADPSFTKLDSGPYDLQDNISTYGKQPTVDPGGTANTKGSYSELSEGDTNSSNNVLNGDSLAQAYDYLGFYLNDNFNTGQTASNTLFDFAYGAAASETIFLDDIHFGNSGIEAAGPGQLIWIPWGRASGDRISSRAQTSTTDATDRIRSVLLFGLR